MLIPVFLIQIWTLATSTSPQNMKSCDCLESTSLEVFLGADPSALNIRVYNTGDVYLSNTSGGGGGEI